MPPHSAGKTWREEAVAGFVWSSAFVELKTRHHHNKTKRSEVFVHTPYFVPGPLLNPGNISEISASGPSGSGCFQHPV